VVLRSRGDVLRVAGQSDEAADQYRQALAIELEPRARTELARLLKTVAPDTAPAP